MNETVHTSEVLPPRAMLFLGIVAFHVVVAYFLAHGLMTTTLRLLTPTKLEAVFLPQEPTKPPPVEQVIENPTLIDPDVVPLPAPEVPVEQIAEPVFTNTVIEPREQIGPAQPVTPVEQPIRLIGHNVMPNTEGYYPPSERRRNGEGMVVVKACVNEGGKLNGAPMVEASSGSGALDDAALRVARDARYARSVRGDVPVPNCHRFRVIFSMH